MLALLAATCPSLIASPRPLHPPSRHSSTRATTVLQQLPQATTSILVEDETVALAHQYVLEAAMQNGGKGKTAVQREACAAIVRSLLGRDGSGGAGGGMTSSSDPASESTGAPSRVTAVLPSGAVRYSPARLEASPLCTHELKHCLLLDRRERRCWR